jgi:nitrite reductase/ring-hydroxylating ferredoxin subunit
MSERVRVAKATDLEPGDRVFIEVGDRSIGVFNIDREYWALLNHCLHDGGPVCEGRVKNKLVGTFGEPGERVTEEFSGPPSVTCP